jgi:hypothetical protein
MNRLRLIGLIATTMLVAACGSAATAANTASPSPSGGPGAAFRNGASGQLVQINAQTLIITGPNGDTVVNYSATTSITRTSSAALADITVGTCVVATGQKGTAGAVTATSVRLAPKPTTGCPAGTGFGPGPGANATPRPSASPRPIPSGLANQTIIAGEVTGISGTSVTILTTASGSQTITVPAAATITRSFAVTASALQTGECLRAAGQRDASGNVQATSLTITPAGPSGTCTSGLGGGRGGFGGGGGIPPAGGAPGAG